MLQEKFRLSDRLVRAIRTAPDTLNSLGFAFGFQSSHLSTLLSGASFGRVRLARVEKLAAKLGVPLEHAVVQVSNDEDVSPVEGSANDELFKACLENLISATRRSAERDVRILTADPNEDVSPQASLNTFQSDCVYWTERGPRPKPLASMERIGELGFILRSLCDRRLIVEHPDQFVRAVRELGEKQDRRLREREDQAARAPVAEHEIAAK